jgi:hypothetical protein
MKHQPIVVLYADRPAAWIGASTADVLRVEEAIRGWTTRRLMNVLVDAMLERPTPTPSSS